MKSSKGTWETSYSLVDLEFPPEVDANNTVIKTSEQVRETFIAAWKTELKQTVTERVDTLSKLAELHCQLV